MGKKGQKGLSLAFLLSAACDDSHPKHWSALDQMFHYENFHREEGALHLVLYTTSIHNSISTFREGLHLLTQWGNFPQKLQFWWTFNNFFNQSYEGMSQPLSCPWGHVPTPAYHNQRDMMELAKTNGLKRFHFTNNLWQETLGCPNSCPTRLLLISASMLNKSLKIDDWKKENLTSIGCHWVDTQLLCACDHKFVVMALAMTHYV